MLLTKPRPKTKDWRLKAKNWRPEPEDLINFRPVKLHVLSAKCFVTCQKARNWGGLCFGEKAALIYKMKTLILTVCQTPRGKKSFWRKGWLKLQCMRHKVCQKKENSVLLYFWFCFSVINENIEKGKSPLPNRDTVLQWPQLDYQWLTVEINEHYLQKILDDFNFGQKKCPKLKLSEILKRPNFWACEMFTVQYETFK